MEKTLNSNCLNLINRIATLTATAILMLFVFAVDLNAQCSVVGTGNVTGNVNFGSSNNWANPNRCTITDDLWSRVQLAAGETSKYLQVSDFGWVIPVGSTIQGIEVTVEGHQEDFIANFADASIRLMQYGTPIGADRAGTGYYDDKDYTNTYGSSTDLWGAAWTPVDIMDPGFGVLYSVTRLSGPGTYYMYVDYIEITVYYTGVGCILPVTYKAYDVVLQANQTAKIDWITSTETNADLYTIERSNDGTNFNAIGSVDAVGNSQTEISYSFVDQDALEGTAYYRIRQMDVDGLSYSTEVRSVTGHATPEFSVTAFPNPVSDHLQLQGSLAGGHAELLDMQGKSVLQSNLVADANTLDVSELTGGIYILRVSTPLGTDNQKIVIR